MSKQPAPEWAANLTVDICLPALNDTQKLAVRAYRDQPLNSVWSRLTAPIQAAILKWWNYA